MSKQPSPRGEPSGVDVWDHGSAEEFEETQRLLATIPGGQALLEWFGGVASFHDAEIVRLHLDREGTSQLEVAVQGKRGGALVTFIFTDWIDTAIAGFSRQNVIGELLLREPGERDAAVWERGVGMLSGDHEIRLTPIVGAYGTIRATISKIELRQRPGKADKKQKR